MGIHFNVDFHSHWCKQFEIALTGFVWAGSSAGHGCGNPN